MAYIKQIYTASIRVGIKTNGPSVTAIVLFCFGAAPTGSASCNNWGSKLSLFSI